MPWISLPHVVAVVIMVLGSALARREDATPIEKVITLLDDLKDEVEDDGKSEADAFEKFSSFCKASTKSKAEDITKGEDKTDDLSSTIEAKTEERKGKKDSILERLGKQESLASELDDTKARCKKDQTVYNAKNLDLTQALDGIKAAQKSLKLAKTGASSLLAVRSSYHDISMALEFVQKSVKRDDAVLLRKHLKVDPQDAEYKWHSSGIDAILQTLHDKYKNHKEEIDAEWKKTEASCQETEAALQKDIETNEDSITKLKETVDSLSQDIAKAKDDLVSEQTALEDAKEYLKDLSSKCEDRTQDWEQRQKARFEESEALSKALQILQGRVKAADEAANKRALLLAHRKRADAPAQEHQLTPAQVTPQTDEPVGDAAADVTAWLHGGAPSFLQVSSAKAASTQEEQAAIGRRRESLLRFVQQEGRRLGSTALASLALRVAGDPFDKVKGLLQQLIERLLEESSGEATKKGFCDEQVGTATQERDYNYERSGKLSADIQVLQAQKEDLDTEANDLQDRIDELKNERIEAQNARDEEKKANAETLQRAKDGLDSVTEAYNILKDFYNQASPQQLSTGNAVLLQASPVDEDAPAAPEGEYEGKQDASKTILGLLAVIVSDFDRTLQKTEAAETKSAADFEDLKQKLEVDIAGQSTKRQLDMQDSKTTATTIKKKVKDLQLAMDVVDASLKRLEELQAMCLGHGRMSFEERTKKREAEIAALKEALCKLDADGVETDCM
mmetsp:Transcript_102278/g.161572  ORF Transcript_102278/g.161572 Transcript_102278/m.161572 type:complete len:735 (-) Transcript_102278:40-2244(-)